MNHTAALHPTILPAGDAEITDLRLVKEKGMTTLMVTHNLRFALEYGSRLSDDDR